MLLAALRCCLSDIILSYSHNDEIISPATRVIIGKVKGSRKRLCVKMWRYLKDNLYDLRDESDRTSYLLEGLNFNRRFNRGIYPGIALLKEHNERTGEIRLGPLIKKPERGKLKQGEYVLVMKYLHPAWRLDRQLHPGSLGTKAGMEFLARSISSMHKQLEHSPEEFGSAEDIQKKLHLNSEQFMLSFPLGGEEKKRYEEICRDIVEAFDKYEALFEKRYSERHIKRCHGDLKSTNLWTRPRKKFCIELRKFAWQLFILDCVDFNSHFYHIDTLSDVAMLAVDLEMRLSSYQLDDKSEAYGQEMAMYFLNTYLAEMEEQGEAVWPLLEYYMTEKAMVCAYISKEYDKEPDLVYRYLQVFQRHAQHFLAHVENQ